MADTLATVQAAYLDNADYDSDGSTAKAKLFRTACRQLLVLLPSSSMRGAGGNQQSAAFKMDEIRAMLAACEDWLTINDTSNAPTVLHPDFTSARGY